MPEILRQHLAELRGRDPEFDCKVARIRPGEFYVASDATAMTTVLGSCVAVCLRDRVNAIAGMNHFLLPERQDSTDDESLSLRYGRQAMDVLLAEMLRAGAQADRLEAKIFGGACVIHGMLDDIGRRNARFARSYLKAKNVPIVAQDLEGTAARKIIFFPANGRVLCKKIHDDSQRKLAELEYQAQQAMSKHAIHSPVSRQASKESTK